MLAVSDADAINEILRARPDDFRRWRDQQAVIEEMGPPGSLSPREMTGSGSDG
jgi:hypothetical protein